MFSGVTSSVFRSLTVLLFSRIKAVDEKFKELNEARKKLTSYFGEIDKRNIANLKQNAISAQAALFENNGELLKKQVAANRSQISEYKDRRQRLRTRDLATSLQDGFAISAGIAPAIPDIASNKDLKDQIEADCWTSVCLEVSSSYTTDQCSFSSNSFSIGSGASWGVTNG